MNSCSVKVLIIASKIAFQGYLSYLKKGKSHESKEQFFSLKSLLQFAIDLQKNKKEYVKFFFNNSKLPTELFKGDSKWNRLCLCEFIHTLQ